MYNFKLFLIYITILLRNEITVPSLPQSKNWELHYCWKDQVKELVLFIYKQIAFLRIDTNNAIFIYVLNDRERRKNKFALK